MDVWYLVIILMIGPSPLSVEVSHREYVGYKSCRGAMIAMTNALNEQDHLHERMTKDRNIAPELAPDFRYHLYCEQR